MVRCCRPESYKRFALICHPSASAFARMMNLVILAPIQSVRNGACSVLSLRPPSTSTCSLMRSGNAKWCSTFTARPTRSTILPSVIAESQMDLADLTGGAVISCFSHACTRCSRKPCLFLMFAAAGTIAPSHSPAAVTKSTAVASAPALKQQTLLSLANAHHRAHQLDSFTAATDTDKREMYVRVDSGRQCAASSRPAREPGAAEEGA